MAIAGLVAVPVVGCDQGGEIAIDDLPASSQAALCRSAAACGDAADQSICEASFFLARDLLAQQAIAAVKRGTLIYDGDRARQCLDELGKGCIDDLGPPPSCDETFRPMVPEGGACQVANECLSGQCDAPCTAGCCAGVCAAGPAKVWAGGDCVAGGPACVEGAFCKGGQCVPDRAIGAVCAFGDVCRRPGKCDAKVGGRGICVTLPGEGDRCIPSATLLNCLRSDDYCDPAKGVCVRRRPPGAACGGAHGECIGFAACRNGVCTPTPTLGQACDLTGGRTCFGQLECAGTSCAAPDLVADACVQ